MKTQSLLAFLSIFFSTPSNSSETGPRVYRISAYQRENTRYFAFTVGTPPQFMVGQIDFRLSSSLALDAMCGRKWRRDCPRYCLDESYRRLYCRPGCLQMNSLEWNLYCSTVWAYGPYNSTQSGSFEDDAEDWRHPYAGRETLLGRYAWDRFEFAASEPPRLTVTRMRFVRGFLLDLELVQRESFLIGLAPSSDNALPIQLTRQSIIPHSIVSFSSALISKDQRQASMWLGGENANCTGWIRRRSASRTEWTLEADEVAIGGVKMESDRVKILFDGSDKANILPFGFAERLIRAGLFEWNRKYNQLFFNRTTDIGLRIRMHETEFRIDSSFLNANEREHGLWRSFYRVTENGPSRYSDEEAVLKLGTHFLTTHCASFDYERREVSLGYNQ